MEPAIQQFVASDGCALRLRRWIPKGPPLGDLVALHGIQSHSGWYGWSSARLCATGWDVRFLDRRGSGLNDADRGHAPHADRLINDVAQVLRDVRARQDVPRPLVLLGLSWGGRLAACVAARRPELLDGLVLLYPAISARVKAGWLDRRLLKLAVAAGDLRRTAPIPLDAPALFTSDPDWQAFIRSDPLALHRATVGFFAASLALETEALASAARIAAPTLLMLAGKDRIIDNAATRRWFGRLGASEKRVVEFPEAAHTLEFEPCREACVAALVEWLARRVVIATN